MVRERGPANPREKTYNNIIRGREEHSTANKTPNGKTVILIVVVGRVQVRRVQVQVVGVVVAVRRTTPVVPVRPSIVRRRTVKVAGVEEIIGKLQSPESHGQKKAVNEPAYNFYRPRATRIL